MYLLFHNSGKKDDNPLSPDFIPSIFSHVPSPKKRRRTKDMDRFEGRRDMKRRRDEEMKRSDAVAGLLDLSVGEDTLPQATTSSNPDSGKLLIPCENEACKEYVKCLETECQALREEVQQYKTIVKSVKFDEVTFEQNDDKVKTMTGLPSYEKMMTVFGFFGCHLKTQSSLSAFQQFILTMLRLRMNMPLSFLSYVFNISLSTTSRIFNNTIDVMYCRIVPALIFWPDRQELRMTLPMVFRNVFKKCACIIDCFEIFIEKPGDLKARVLTYSQYKSHNTMKYLIGITPQGTVSFISKGWGGRTSDKCITENSGFLDHIVPGDTILADRGFDVGDTIGLYNAQLKIPAFTKGKKQLSPADIESTRGLAAVRIHVERVIGVVRQKYSMLQGTISIPLCVSDDMEQPTPLDKIVSVCCALTNACPSVVPFE